MKLVSPNFPEIMEPNITIKQFPDGDSYIKLPAQVVNLWQDTKLKTQDHRNRTQDTRHATLFHRLWPNQDSALVQAFLMLSTLKKAGVRTTLVSPYLPYARQDKSFEKGEVLSAEEICRLLAACGAEMLVTLDCHFLKKEGESEYCGLKIKNVSMAKALIEHAKKKLNNEPFEVLSPDQGASYMVKGCNGGSMEKVRGGYDTGKEAYRKIEEVRCSLNVHGKNVLILDDMISTGGTMLRAVENMQKGGAKRILCAATHGLFLKGSLEKLQGCCEHVFATDSIRTSVSEVGIRDVLRGTM